MSAALAHKVLIVIMYTTSIAYFTCFRKLVSLAFWNSDAQMEMIRGNVAEGGDPTFPPHNEKQHVEERS